MKKTIITILIAITVLMCLTGCSTTPDSASETKELLMILGGVHSNALSLKFNNDTTEKAIYNTISSGGIILALQVDGNPELVYGSSFESVLDYKNSNPTKFKQDVKKLTAQAEKDLQSSLKPNDPEVDMMKALNMAVRALADYPNYKKTLLIMDSGLPTAGSMNYQNNLISADPEIIASDLYNRKEIPDFSSISTILWAQLGDVCYPQSELSGIQKDNLEKTWTAIIYKGGGTLFLLQGLPGNTLPSQSNYPNVSVIVLPKDEPIWYAPKQTSYNLNFQLIYN